MNEEWKLYYNGPRVKYEISNIGRIKRNGIIVEPKLHCGYLCYSNICIHRAVAELFISNPENKPEVDHIDTNRFNNRAENLRWVTHIENCNNEITLEKIRINHPRLKGSKNGMFNYKWTDEQRKKISKTKRERYIKRIWIYKGEISKLISVIEKEKYIGDGWNIGRHEPL